MGRVAWRAFSHQVASQRRGLVMAPYTISIRNQSGSRKSYAVFSEAPKIKSIGSDATITTRIIMSVHGVANESGQASFVLSKQLYANCGTYDVDSDGTDEDISVSAVGTGTEVVDLRPIVLGHHDPTGKLVPGTSLEIDAQEGSPSFTPNLPDVQDGEVNSFVVRTKGHFTYQQAKLNKYVVGFGSSTRQTIGPYATFVPGPNTVYHIKPSSVFYVAIGEHNVRDLVLNDLKNAPSTCCIDFGNPDTDDVQLVNDKSGKLNRIVPACV